MRIAPIRFSWLSTLLLLWLLCASTLQAGYKQIQAPLPNDPMGVNIFELDNGLRVYLSVNHTEPLFYAEVVVRTGSKNDPAETTGLAHYLEHLMFKGSQRLCTLDYEKEKPHLDKIEALYEQHFRETDPDKRKEIYKQINAEAQLAAQYAIPNELDATYKALGESGLNAHTSVEETVYRVSLPSNRLAQWATLESDRFQHPIFRLFHTELETVYEEKNISLDNKDEVFEEAVEAKLFKVHPYGQQPTIGKAEHLKKPSLVKIRNYFETYYVPNNMALCLSGDLDIPSTMQLLDETFSGWKSRPLPKPVQYDEKPLQGREHFDLKFRGEEAVMLAFRAPNTNDTDSDAMKLLGTILFNGQAGLIDLNLIQEQKVRSASAMYYPSNDYGRFYLMGIPKKGQTHQEVEDLLLAQLDKVRKGEFDDWMLQAAINNAKADLKRSYESNQERVQQMRGAFLEYQSWEYVNALLDRLQKVTKADVVAAANRHLGANFVSGWRLDEQQEVLKIQKPQIDPINIDRNRQSGFSKSVLAMPVQPIEPTYVTAGKDYVVSDTPNGTRFFSAANPINDIFDLSITFEVGNRHDPRLDMAAELREKSGTENLPVEKIKQEWYKLASSFSVMVSDNETTLHLSGLDENLEASLALALDTILKPKVEPATLQELIAITLANREDERKDPNTLASAMCSYALYGSDSPFLKRLTRKQLQKLTVEELQKTFQNLFQYKCTVSYAGALPREKVLEIFNKHYPQEKPLKNEPPHHFMKTRRARENEIYFLDNQMAQSLVNIGFGDGVYQEALLPNAQVFHDYFGGGMGGVVFQELREARGLAYTARAGYNFGDRVNDENVVTGYIGTQSDKTCESVEAFLNLFNNIPLSEDRFSKTIESLVNLYSTSRLTFREVADAVISWEYLGLKDDPRKARLDAIRKEKSQDLAQFHAEHIKSAPRIMSIVGDKSRIDMERLAKSGKIVNVKKEEIFRD
ncbi:MAG TPA: insulinase family protein [Candidatus Sumerlaeota bacterium]|nr:insulinase family protein [Candidatus Sumerlaeota bacterium]